MTKYKKIKPAEAKKIMDSRKNIRILDVRTHEEHEEGCIFESICIPLEDIAANAENILKDKKETILVYCQSGKRSLEACKMLISMGYQDVMDFGGIIDWNFEIVY